ncbi:RstB2 protein [Vibrio parahaemolyticus]|nr:RstB2 protein [Vibrio parahaemolyticus]
MSANPALLAEFDKIQNQFPVKCVLTLEPDPENPQRNLVTDFKIAELEDEL